MYADLKRIKIEYKFDVKYIYILVSGRSIICEYKIIHLLSIKVGFIF